MIYETPAISNKIIVSSRTCIKISLQSKHFQTIQYFALLLKIWNFSQLSPGVSRTPIIAPLYKHSYLLQIKLEIRI